ncbi:MAG: carotenoid biosynthesis protein [candidate division KSB1 bacterium]|nr:carotenoid biosynthesis protein [candidate division KSB1 bacterium]MDZ7366444.1 carotenoid biosynthesis protein [candidate division KSB1 bacterium]MDZ7404594.1 carotenoid biosynthesis protein [candidate division KSB1 bacterium]
MKIDQHKVKIIFLYVLLLAGGLWHILGVLQNAMRLLAAPMIVGLCLLLCYEHLCNQFDRKFILWGVFVCLASFFIELAGVKTGVIFGSYFYGEILQPVVWNVPIAIGFAWLVMIVSSAAVSQYLLPARFVQRPARIALVIALLMVIFDLFMEPAATKLGYWTWDTESIPLRNYLAWFVFGFILSYIGLRLGLFMKKSSVLAVHAYIAQLCYFVLVSLA